MIETEERATPRRNPLLSPVRFLLHWTIKVVVLFFMFIGAILRPKLVRFGLAALVLLGVVGWNYLVPRESPAVLGSTPQAPPARAASSPAVVSVPATEKLDRPAAVEQYLKAQSNFDADGMWASISDDLKQQLASSNTTLDDLKAQLDTARKAGRHYGQAVYVGGVTLDDSEHAYFYVLTVDTPNGTQHVPYTYVVDGDGKIASIQ